VLHALAPAFRGRGLGRGFWTAGCRMMFDQGRDEIDSSVSASNLAVINLYSSLGFALRGAVDVYHLRG
jgi:ribosomal protein S18 acetylase RimI-like enzyme